MFEIILSLGKVESF